MKRYQQTVSVLFQRLIETLSRHVYYRTIHQNTLSVQWLGTGIGKTNVTTTTQQV